MPATAAQDWRRHLTCILTRLTLLAGIVCALPAAAQTASNNKPILAPPPSVWDHQMLSGRPLLSQTVSDFAAITNDILFGMGPGEANDHLPTPAAGVSWNTLPPATEFQDDVRYFWVRFQDAGALRVGATACVGPDSYIVFLFRPRGLFRISYRLLPSAACPTPIDAAEQIFGRYVTLSTDIALSVHYRAGPIEVVDVTDPTAGYLIATRWQPHAE